MIEASMAVFLPEKLEIWMHEGVPYVSVREMTPPGVLLAPAFVILHAVLPIAKTAPTPVGWALQTTGEPNCILMPGVGLWTLWTLKEVAPREPLSIDVRLYDL